MKMQFYLATFTLAALMITGAPARSADPEAARRMHDTLQTIHARKLLLADPQLGPLNLGVSVRNRVAMLWGPVPSLDLSRRAEQRLRGMFELVEVQNRLFVPEDQ
ncbi:MAG: BON domain-containing protein [Gemmataceae bacterium]|nr:BON domain-containing protein [Gemmataceae bacterium]MCI0740687.1 BON domain-containing protein [Gemmataceae bacterium]